MGSSELADAGTVHVGGTRKELARAENEVSAGRHPERPYVLVAQPSRFDRGRAPAGRHILWAYCHVPAGSTRDMGEAVTAQLERFAPGFRDVVVQTHVTTAAELASYNRNYIGGDFSAGIMDVRGLLQRPVVSPIPWRTPVRGVYLCSSSTPPGPGVTGMPGFFAAKACLEGHIRPRRSGARPVSPPRRQSAVTWPRGLEPLARRWGHNNAVGNSKKLSLAIAGLILGASLVACDDGRGGAESAAKQFAAAVSALDVGSVAFDGKDSAVAKQQVQDVFKALDPAKPAVESGELTLEGETATVPAELHLENRLR